jgi:hypothetical protein
MITPTRQQFIDILTALSDHMSRWNPGSYRLVMDMCSFIGKHFCDCKYVEYFVFDMNFGKNQCFTEMGYELRDVKNIEQFIDFLYDYKDKP